MILFLHELLLPPFDFLAWAICILYAVIALLGSPYYASLMSTIITTPRSIFSRCLID